MLTALVWVALGILVLCQAWRVVRSVRDAVRRHRADRPGPADLQDMFTNPLMPPLALVVVLDADCESSVANIRALSRARYPQLEILVAAATECETARDEVAAALASPDGEDPADLPVHVTVLDEVYPDAAAAANAAVNAARYPMVCILDAEWRPDADAFLCLIRPFVNDDDRVAVALTKLSYRPGLRRHVGPVAGLRQLARPVRGRVGLFRRRDIAAVGGITGEPDGAIARLAETIAQHRDVQGFGSAIVPVPGAVIATAMPARSGLAATVTKSGRRSTDWPTLVEIAGWAIVGACVAAGAAPAWLVVYALMSVGLGAVIGLGEVVAAGSSRPLRAMVAALVDNLGPRYVRAISGPTEALT